MMYVDPPTRLDCVPLVLTNQFLLQLNELEKEEAGLGATIAEMEAYA